MQLCKGRTVGRWVPVLLACCALTFIAAKGRHKPKGHAQASPTPEATVSSTATAQPLAPAVPANATAVGLAHATRWFEDAYWRDGKAEFNTYDAKIVRYGEARPCEVIHVVVREDFAPNTMVKADNWKGPGVYPVLKLNQILHIPTGLYVYQQMHSAFWRIGDGSLIKWSLTSCDSCGNTFKQALRATAKGMDEPAAPWKYEFRTYWQGMEGGEETLRPPADGYFYDELPVLVRAIDFTAPEGSFPLHLTKTVIQSKRDTLSFAPALVNYTTDTDKGLITVVVSQAGGKDEFLLDAKAPHLLREWHMADGGELRLKSSLKIDYWNYNKLGDKERAHSEVKDAAAPQT